MFLVSSLRRLEKTLYMDTVGLAGWMAGLVWMVGYTLGVMDRIGID